MIDSKFRTLFWPIATTLLLLCFGCDDVRQNKEKPNVIFILADDLGYAELGTYGSSFNETPNLDSLAANGLKFTQAYAAAPVCSPVDGKMELWIDGELVDQANIGEALPIPPDDPLSIGYDFRRLVGIYGADNYYTGTMSGIYFNVTE